MGTTLRRPSIIWCRPAHVALSIARCRVRGSAQPRQSSGWRTGETSLEVSVRSCRWGDRRLGTLRHLWVGNEAAFLGIPRPRVSGQGSQAQTLRPRLSGPDSQAQTLRPRVSGPDSQAQSLRPRVSGQSLRPDFLRPGTEHSALNVKSPVPRVSSRLECWQTAEC